MHTYRLAICEYARVQALEGACNNAMHMRIHIVLSRLASKNGVKFTLEDLLRVAHLDRLPIAVYCVCVYLHTYMHMYVCMCVDPGKICCAYHTCLVLPSVCVFACGVHATGVHNI